MIHRTHANTLQVLDLTMMPSRKVPRVRHVELRLQVGIGVGPAGCFKQRVICYGVELIRRRRASLPALIDGGQAMKFIVAVN
jgi:hypothetical protein